MILYALVFCEEDMHGRAGTRSFLLRRSSESNIGPRPVVLM